MDMCYLACAYRTPSGYCGRTGGAATCPHRHKKPSNGDRIRAMSDEELANAKIVCPYSAENMDMCEKWIVSGDTRDCAACALDWLRQEADT